MRTRVIALVLPLLVAVLAAQPSPRELFERARVLEESNRNLTEAIALYTRVASQAKERELAAAAELRVGLLHERLGHRAEAQRAFTSVVTQYPDHADIVRQAQARLAAAGAAISTAPAARRTWAGEDVELSGAPSPDGRSMSYVDWETGDLAIRDLATGARRRLTGNPTFMRAEGFAQASAFSPDGKQIAYIWFDQQGMDLRVVRVDGGAPRILRRNADMAMLRVSWGGNGDELVVSYQRPDRTHQLAMIVVASGAIRTLKSLDWRAPARIALSPDGRYVAYDFPPKEDSPNRDVYVLAVDGTRETVVVEHAANDLFPVWTPDGRQLVFVSDRTGTPGLWTVLVERGRAQGSPRLIQPVGRVVPLGFSRSGALFYGLGTGTIDVYVAELDVASGKVLAPARAAPRQVVGVNSRPRWSPDGRYLTYQSDRVPGEAFGARRLIMLTVDTGQERDLNVPLPYFQRAEWSPDGRSLLMHARSPKGSRGFFRIDVETSDTTLAIPSPQSSFGQTWAPDGRSVFLTRSDSGGPRIVEWNVESGAERIVYSAPAKSTVDGSSISPDGRWLAFREGNAPTMIKILPIVGGDAREIVRVDEPDSIPGSGGINWTLDGRHLLFVRASGPMELDRTVWKVAVADGATQKTELTGKSLRDLHLHPDGRRLAFTAGEGADELWVIENLLAPSRPSATSGRR